MSSICTRSKRLLQLQFYEKLISGSSKTKDLDVVEEKDGDEPRVSLDGVEGEADGVPEVSLEEKVNEKDSEDVDTPDDRCGKVNEIVSVSQKIPETEANNTTEKENGDRTSSIPQSTNIEALLEEEMAELRDEKQVLVSIYTW